uniref:O-methyltransferase n=1 Tax=Panagrellus redivivus TaxID=6233 RepID=A0A7E4W5V9_PANRE
MKAFQKLSKTHMSPLARKRLVKGESLVRSMTSEPEILFQALLGGFEGMETLPMREDGRSDRQRKKFASA